ncbi:MAG: hypothetical protein H0V80_15575 [Acidobacteria bacterium]|nr:hypothetical protein [Acidobacteriota bacterium]
MIPDGVSTSELIQHAIVGLVALWALTVVLRKVLGVFEKRPASQAPACGNCAAGQAAHKKPGTPSR